MRKGFTLLELIVVVIIVGILASIAVPQFFKVAERARSAEGQAAIGALRGSQMRYYAEKGLYTNDETELDMENPPNGYRFFNVPVASNASNDLASIERNSGVAWPAGNGTAYEIHIDEDGNIWCENNEPVCKRIGLEYR